MIYYIQLATTQYILYIDRVQVRIANNKSFISWFTIINIIIISLNTAIGTKIV